MFRNKKFFIIIIAGGAILAVWFFIGGREEPKACTMEAKLCADGSAVGRTGPNCEFSACPPEALCEGGACPKEDLIRVESPAANEIISSPLVIKGKARGFWFFEASFPVILTDWDGRIIAQSHATAKSDPEEENGAGWMTENFVPFEATLEFEKPAAIKGVVNRGALTLKKDNPSGLAEHDDSLEIPVFFDSPAN